VAGRAARHRGQSGTTLIELLVATLIMGLAVVMLVGLFSTGAVQSMLANRDAAAQAATAYELEKVGAAQYSSSPTSYSECFASDGISSTAVVAYQGTCPGASKIRADVSVRQIQGNLQQWTIVVNGAAGGPIGNPVSTFRVNR